MISQVILPPQTDQENSFDYKSASSAFSHGLARALQYTGHNISITMKTSLSLLALLFALALPAEAFAGLAGLPVPAVLNSENTHTLFFATFVHLILIADYRPRLSTLPRSAGRKIEIRPAVLGVTGTRSNAYGVRQTRRFRAPVAI